MARESFKKKKKESFLSKVVNFVLTLALVCFIASQVCNAANNNLRFAQVSDAHFSSFEENTSYKMLKDSSKLLDDVVLQINTSGAYDFVVFTGDLINKPKTSELENFIKHANRLIYPWYAIDGNHDVAIGGDLTKNKFLSIEFCNLHFIFKCDARYLQYFILKYSFSIAKFIGDVYNMEKSTGEAYRPHRKTEVCL